MRDGKSRDGNGLGFTSSRSIFAWFILPWHLVKGWSVYRRHVLRIGERFIVMWTLPGPTFLITHQTKY